MSNRLLWVCVAVLAVTNVFQTIEGAVRTKHMQMHLGVTRQLADLVKKLSVNNDLLTEIVSAEVDATAKLANRLQEHLNPPAVPWTPVPTNLYPYYFSSTNMWFEGIVITTNMILLSASNCILNVESVK